MRVVYGILALVVLSLARGAFGDELLRHTIPGKWLDQILPETDREPYYPDYVRNDPFSRAVAQINVGQYRRALSTLAKIPGAPTPAVSLATAKALAELGRYDEALAALDPADLDCQLLRCDILGREQRYPEAIALANKLIAAHPDSVAAHYFLGLDKERSGDYDGALAAYQWFSAAPRNYVEQWRGHAHDFNNAQEVVLIGKGLDRWATLSGAYTQDTSLHQLILSMFTAAYNRIDTEDYSAHTAAAEYFYNHDDDDKAIGELEQALNGNPHDVEAHKLAATIANDSFNFAGTESEITEIRDVDPDSTAASILEARDLLQQRRPKEATGPLQQVLSKYPSDIEALGLLAGAQALLLHDDAMNATLKQADSLQPKSPIAYFEVAEQLSAMRQYPRAEAMYKIALARAPWWTKVRDGLGLLMTQSGDEDLARVVLEAAHAVDPFNVRAVNYLKLLDQMDQFQKKESAHFIVMYDPKLDPVVPEYFSDYLESVYPIVTSDFHYEPKVKTLIEVFPTHDAFSVRTTGAPWIATVGASTGRVIALAAPRNGGGGPFNWSRVVRHEFTHTVTLGATDNRISHWFTEGLAVWEEHSPLQWEWVPLLDDAVTHNKLFPLENLTWAFIRPQQPSDRQLAYAESFWIVTFIEQKYGHAAILTLLDQARLGHDLDEAFTAAVHEDSAKFFAEFESWTRQQVATWGYDEVSTARYNLLVPEAEELTKAKNYARAAEIWEAIVKLRPMDAYPHYKLDGLYLQLEDWDKAIEQLKILSSVELTDNRYVHVLAYVYAKEVKLDLACQAALKAVYINPYDIHAHEYLQKLDTQAGDTAGAAREAKVIPILQAWLNANTQIDDSNTARPSPTAQ